MNKLEAASCGAKPQNSKHLLLGMVDYYLLPRHEHCVCRHRDMSAAPECSAGRVKPPRAGRM
jgi:hypothetical protein